MSDSIRVEAKSRSTGENASVGRLDDVTETSALLRLNGEVMAMANMPHRPVKPSDTEFEDAPSEEYVVMVVEDVEEILSTLGFDLTAASRARVASALMQTMTATTIADAIRDLERDDVLAIREEIAITGTLTDTTGAQLALVDDRDQPITREHALAELDEWLAAHPDV